MNLTSFLSWRRSPHALAKYFHKMSTLISELSNIFVLIHIHLMRLNSSHTHKNRTKKNQNPNTCVRFFFALQLKRKTGFTASQDVNNSDWIHRSEHAILNVRLQPIIMCKNWTRRCSKPHSPMCVCVCVLFQTSIYDKSKAIDCWIRNGGLPLEWFWEILAIIFDSIWFD